MSDSAFHAQRFGRAAATYSNAASIQTELAADLIRRAFPSKGIFAKGDAPLKILELGCGTGLATIELMRRLPQATFLATDFSEAMLKQMKVEFSLQSAPLPRTALLDARGPVWTLIPDDSQALQGFDILFSNALLQWFTDLRAHFSAASKALLPGGHYACALFSKQNFPELNQILSTPPFSMSDFPGHEESELRSAAENEGFQVELCRPWKRQEWVQNGVAVLKRIQTLGSARRPGNNPLSRKSLKLLLDRYERDFGTEEGVPMTWNAWLLVLKLKEAP